MKRIWFEKKAKYNDVAGLKDFVKMFPKRCVMVEIGTFAGVSAMFFAKHCTKLSTVDAYDMLEPYGVLTKEILVEAEKRFKKLMKKNKLLAKKIVQIKDFSIVAATHFEDKSLDVVYIDGAHFYDDVKSDIDTWLPKLKIGGLLAGHDIQIDHVVDALKDTIGKPDKVFDDNSWVWRVR